MKKNKKFQYWDSITLEGNIVMSETTNNVNIINKEAKKIKKSNKRRKKQINLIDGLDFFKIKNLNGKWYKFLWIFNYLLLILFVSFGISNYMDYFENGCNFKLFHQYLFIFNLIFWIISNFYTLLVINYVILLKLNNIKVRKKINKIFIIFFQFSTISFMIELFINNFTWCIEVKNSRIINLIIYTNYIYFMIILIFLLKSALKFNNITLVVTIQFLSFLYKLLFYICYFWFLIFIIFKLILFIIFLVTFNFYTIILIWLQIFIFIYFLILLIIWVK